ncbi:hypothetical protein [Robertmurraya massiliosenegalensis]|uniref:hypothetical protein n=1 Tax=Robertmurraya massiliosenegalensis TaxID=1287657 RepID=UPI00030589E5|nr:hypothetical protein [Robertmurraya massiliosenegalensis]
MLMRLLPKKKAKVFTNLLFDIPVHHHYYMKYNKLRVGSCIPHKDIEEIYGRTNMLNTNLLYGRTGQFLFVARGEEMINHILKHGSVPVYRHPAILIQFPLNSDNLLKKRVQYFRKHDEKLISF